jgi:hypothetical protein
VITGFESLEPIVIVRSKYGRMSGMECTCGASYNVSCCRGIRSQCCVLGGK